MLRLSRSFSSVKRQPCKPRLERLEDRTALTYVNLAYNPTARGFPHPLESDRGWGGGALPWEIVDGQEDYAEWYHGLAFTGGHNGSGGYWIEPAGPRQSTIDFGEPKVFEMVVIWHHGDDHVPAETGLQYYGDEGWIDIDFGRYFDSEYVSWGAGSKPDYYFFEPVVGSKVRYTFDNSGNNYLGTPNIHGWLYEFEVYGDDGSDSGPVGTPDHTLLDADAGLGDVIGRLALATVNRLAPTPPATVSPTVAERSTTAEAFAPPVAESLPTVETTHAIDRIDADFVIRLAE